MNTDNPFEFDYLVFIGRFQPFHEAHLWTIRQALTRAREVVVVIGSSFAARCLKNPFGFSERERMIHKALGEDSSRVTCVPLMDSLYNDDRWVRDLQLAVQSVTADSERVGLIGHDKDESSYYLKLFPVWPFIETSDYKGLSATPIREAYIAEAKLPTAEQVPNATLQFLECFLEQEEYQWLAHEHAAVHAFKKQWSVSPYPPVFVTVDAVVVMSGHILLVRRGGPMGADLFALPGGYLEQDESLKEACLRELKEETGIDLKTKKIKNMFKATRCFSHPERSARGRVITHAFWFESNNKLPKLKAGDDAADAFWLPLSELDPELMYEDHHAIILEMLRL